MDLGKLNSKKMNEGTDLIIRDPRDGSKTDIVITVVGADSDIYQSCSNKQMDKRFKVLQKRRSKNLSAAEIQDEHVQLYAKCTLGWKNVNKGKEEVPFSKESAIALYKEFPWIFEQVEDFVEDRANFL